MLTRARDIACARDYVPASKAPATLDSHPEDSRPRQRWHMRPRRRGPARGCDFVTE